MSTSLLYHAFAIRGYYQTRIEFAEDAIKFHVAPNEKTVCCSSCGSSDVVRRGSGQREFLENQWFVDSIDGRRLGLKVRGVRDWLRDAPAADFGICACRSL